MSVTVILEAQVSQENKAQLLQLLNNYLPETYEFKGFIDITIFSETDTNTVLFISKWTAFSNYQAYLKWRTETGVMEILGALLETPPLIRRLDTEISFQTESGND